MRIFLAVLASSFALSSAAVAQTAADNTPNAEQLEARAREMIDAAGAQDFFTPEAHPPAVALRHSRSGMLCRFGYQSEARIALVPSASLGIARGDDVACSQNTSLGAVTLYATRRETSLDAALAGSVAALRVMHPDARAVELSELPTVDAEREIPESRTAAFLLSGGQLFTRISVYVTGGWEYKLRFTSPTPRGNIIADLVWNAMLADLMASAEVQ